MYVMRPSRAARKKRMGCCIFGPAFGSCTLQTLVEFSFFCTLSQNFEAKIIKMRPKRKMNTEKVNFDQCLECAAHKCWSKYTTMGESKPWDKEKVEQEKS